MLADAWIVWRDFEGGDRKFQILDASRHGICFGLEDGAAPFLEGTEMGDVVLEVSGAVIRGRLIVTQMVDSTSRGATCGGEFFPASLDDDECYSGVVAGLEQISRLKYLS